MRRGDWNGRPRGHTLGDKLLQSVAKRLLGRARGSDTVSRQGGVEFIVLVSFEPVIIATRMPEAHFIDPHELHVITSICVAVYPEDGLDAATLIKNEDIAMYLAKRMVARATSFSGRSLRP
jgi:diguanylate cyclase